MSKWITQTFYERGKTKFKKIEIFLKDSPREKALIKMVCQKPKNKKRGEKNEL